MNASFLRHRYAVTAAALVTLTAGTAFAVPVPTTPAQIQIVGSDLAAAQFPAQPLFLPISRAVGSPGSSAATSPIVLTSPVPGVPFGYYPADLSNPTHGSTLGDASGNVTFHNIIVNPLIPAPNVYSQSLTGPTLADADTFLTNLVGSTFIQLLDQYTGLPGASRSVGQAGVITFTSFKTTYGDQELAMFLHAAGRTFGTGKNKMVNLFFKKGTDICTTFGGPSAQCYSPDVPSTFAFCGYHSYIDFTDIGRVVYSVEPYENVAGCQVPLGGNYVNGSPNGRAIDSMASVLSHEVFEAATDPLLDAWYIQRGAFGGNEIGDICAFVYSLPGPMLSGTEYRVQSEYSNIFHACSFGPAPVN
jgi:hypothetical protein